MLIIILEIYRALNPLSTQYLSFCSELPHRTSVAGGGRSIEQLTVLNI